MLHTNEKLHQFSATSTVYTQQVSFENSTFLHKLHILHIKHIFIPPFKILQFPKVFIRF